MFNVLRMAGARIGDRHIHTGQVVGAKFEQHRESINLACGILGVTLLSLGLINSADAQLTARYNDKRIADAVNVVFTYIEGSFGALVMVCAGVGAILSSAFGQYRAALGLMVVALGSFTLRSFVGTFFNDRVIRG